MKTAPKTLEEQFLERKSNAFKSILENAAKIKEESSMKEVYTVSGHYNPCYGGIFCRVFKTKAAMLEAVKEYMARDMGMDLEEFEKLRTNDPDKFFKEFREDGRTYMVCLEDQAYYCPYGYEIAWGKKEIEK